MCDCMLRKSMYQLESEAGSVGLWSRVQEFRLPLRQLGNVFRVDCGQVAPYVSHPSFWETVARTAVSSRPAWTISETLCHSGKEKF